MLSDLKQTLSPLIAAGTEKAHGFTVNTFLPRGFFLHEKNVHSPNVIFFIDFSLL